MDALPLRAPAAPAQAPGAAKGLRARWRRLWDSRHPRSDRLLLTHRNVYILPTAAGWVFAVTLLVLLVASINYQLNLGYLLTFLLGGCSIVSMHMTHRNLRGLQGHLRAPQPVHAGEAVRLEATVSHDARFERLAIGMKVAAVSTGPDATGAPAGRRTQPQPELWTWFDLGPGASDCIHLSVPAWQRGRLMLPQITLYTRYPFGLFRAWSVWRPGTPALVWPQPERQAPPLPFTAADGGPGGPRPPRPRHGDEPEGVRDWRRGDPPKLVAWKKSTRTLAAQGTLVSRDREQRTEQDRWIDWAHAAPLPPEERLSRLTAWVWRADRGGDAYGLRLPGCEVPPGRGDAHRLRCLEALALWQPPR